MTPRWHRTVSGLGGLVLAAALAGCGGGGSEPSAQPTESPRTDLTITVTGGPEESWTLTCAPDGGTHPHPDQACAALAKNAAALEPVGDGQVCTEIFGGAQKATVTGTWRGEDVNATLSRANGCEIKRWTDLAGLLPAT